MSAHSVDGGRLTATEYAKRRGVSRQALHKAIGAGKLEGIAVREGRRWYIADPEAADRALDATTDHSRAPAAVKEAAERRRRPAKRKTEAAPTYSLANESAREKHWKANLAELEYRARAGELVSTEDARAKVEAKLAIVRQRLLGIPRRLRQRLPHLSAADVGIVEEGIREALEEIAAGAS